MVPTFFVLKDIRISKTYVTSRLKTNKKKSIVNEKVTEPVNWTVDVTSWLEALRQGRMWPAIYSLDIRVGKLQEQINYAG